MDGHHHRVVDGAGFLNRFSALQDTFNVAPINGAKVLLSVSSAKSSQQTTEGGPGRLKRISDNLL